MSSKPAATYQVIYRRPEEDASMSSKPAATYQVIYRRPVTGDASKEIVGIEVVMAAPLHGFTEARMEFLVAVGADDEIRERVCWRIKQSAWVVYHPDELLEALDEEPPVPPESPASIVATPQEPESTPEPQPAVTVAQKRSKKRRHT